MKAKVLLLGGLLLFLSATAWGREPLRINTSIKPPFSTAEQDGFFDRLLKELFSRVGAEIELTRLPAERALQMANAGYSDGDGPRISGLSRQYPNLIAVPEPLIDYNFVAFTRRPRSAAINWSSLAGETVGLIIGWKIFEDKVPPTSRLTRVGSPAQLLHLLDAGRIDYALYERYAGRALIRGAGYRDIIECRPPLAVRPMYLYLHSSHANLVAGVAAELRKMKRDGRWQEIANQTLER